MFVIMLYLLAIAITLGLLAITFYSYTITQEFTETRMVTHIKRGAKLLYSSHIHISNVTKESKKEEIQKAKKYIKQRNR